KMHDRLVEMSINRTPRGKVLRNINRGKVVGAFNPKYPVNKDEFARGAKPVLFNPSVNYVIEDPATREVIGFFQLKYLRQTPIFGVAVKDSRHHQGLGRMGIRIAMDTARRLGMKTVRLTDFPSNPAFELYEQEGFREIGHTTIHKGLPTEREEILMEKTL
ncbi:MAG: GNAT family N-acetyltransferase, partial [archaeon]